MYDDDKDWPDGIESLVAKASSLRRDGKRKEAQSVIDEARNRLEQLRQTSEAEGDTSNVARTWLCQGQVDWCLGRHATAKSCLQRAQEMYSELGDSKQQGESLFWLGSSLRQCRKVDQAIEAFESALSLFKQASASERQLKALTSLIWLYRHNCQHDEAERLADEIQGIAANATDHLAAAWDLTSFASGEMVMGYVKRQTEGERDRAEQASRAVEAARAGGDPKKLSFALSMFAMAASATGREAEARSANLEVLSLEQGRGDKLGEASAHASLGLFESHANNHDAARMHLKSAISLFVELGDHSRAAEEWRFLGDVEAETKNYEGALAAYGEARAIELEMNDCEGEAFTLYRIAWAERGRGQWSQAYDALQEAWALHRKAKDFQGEIGVIRNLADLEHHRSNSEQARALYQRACQMFEAKGELSGEGWTLRDLGDMERDLGEYDAAKSAYERAQSLFKQICDNQGQASMAWKLGYLHRDVDPAAAKKHYLRAAAFYRRLGDEAREGRAKARAAQL